MKFLLLKQKFFIHKNRFLKTIITAGVQLNYHILLLLLLTTLLSKENWTEDCNSVGCCCDDDWRTFHVILGRTSSASPSGFGTRS